MEDECLNLKPKKSFISFDEVLTKIDKSKNNKSFIESNEKTSILEANQFSNKELI